MKQLDLNYDPCATHHGGDPCSTAAHTRHRSRKATILRAILDHLHRCGTHGATCYEIEQALGLSHQTASARCAELKHAGAVRIGGYRPTGTGSRAGVLIATPQALQVIKL